MFPILPFFLAFIVWLAFRLSKAKKSTQKRIDDFWEKEKKADLAPPKDLRTLEYVTVPVDTFPFGKVFDSEIEMIESSLLELSHTKMLNINGKLNADIKQEYGASNLDAVAAMGDRFEQMTMLLVDYAKALIEAGEYAGAMTVLEYGRSAGSDVSGNYTLLGDCYKQLGMTDKLNELRADAELSSLPRKAHIVDYLNNL